MNTNHRSVFTKEELSILHSAYPQITDANTPSLDDVVIMFLRKHDVHISAVNSNIDTSAASNAFVGLLGGPGYVAANIHLTQQQKSAALQEWTSWKQWTLSHKYFPAFNESILSTWKTNHENSLAFLRENERELREFLNNNYQSHRQFLVIISAVSAIGALLIFFMFGAIIKYMTGQSRPLDSQVVSKQGLYQPSSFDLQSKDYFKVKARSDAWIEVQDLEGKILYVNMLLAEESAQIRLGQGARIRSDHPNLLDIALPDQPFKPLGRPGDLQWHTIMPTEALP
jgi:hypothetical protein